MQRAGENCVAFDKASILQPGRASTMSSCLARVPIILKDVIISESVSTSLLLACHEASQKHLMDFGDGFPLLCDRCLPVPARCALPALRDACCPSLGRAGAFVHTSSLCLSHAPQPFVLTMSSVFFLVYTRPISFLKCTPSPFH